MIRGMINEQKHHDIADTDIVERGLELGATLDEVEADAGWPEGYVRRELAGKVANLDLASFGQEFRNWLGHTPEGYAFTLMDMAEYYKIYQQEGLPPFDEWIKKMTDGKTAEEYFSPLRKKH